jgi:ORF6N domain
MLRMSKPPAVQPEDIAARIINVRGMRVLLDSELAAMYGVPTKRFNEAVRRNADRFPTDFSFHLTEQEVANLRSQFATSSLNRATHGGRRTPPQVFTEHGAIMAAMILNSARAVQMSVYVVRAFVKLREVLASNATLARRLETLERSVAALDSDTRKQFDQVYEAILGLMGSGPRRN